mgnify:CR=1
MVWVDAATYIALMKYAQANGYLAAMDEPRNTVRLLPLAPESERAIPKSSVGGRSPQPTP